MAWTDKDFERDIMGLSEIETCTENDIQLMAPRTIQQYEARMSANRSASIFDNGENNYEHSDVTYVISGRGRGGRNTYYKPGGAIKGKIAFDSEEEIKNMIRKVSGMGYTNDIVEAAIKAKQSKPVELDSVKETKQQIPDLKLIPSSSKSSSSSSTPTPNSTPSSSRRLTSQSTPKLKLNNTLSSSESFSEMMSSSFSNLNPEAVDFTPLQFQTIENDIKTSKDPQTAEPNVKKFESHGAIPKPMPLSQMLRQNKIKHGIRTPKENVSERLCKENAKKEPENVFSNDEISQRKLSPARNEEQENVVSNDERSWRVSPARKEVRLTDSLYENVSWKSCARNEDSSTDSSYENDNFSRKSCARNEDSLTNSSYENDTLSWRRRGNSPPRFFQNGWGNTSRNLSKKLDLNSVMDFPYL